MKHLKHFNNFLFEYFQNSENAEDLNFKLFNVDDLSKLVEPLKLVYPDAGYHSGSLGGKSDYLTRGYYGDMPFTGYYFISNPEEALKNDSRYGHSKSVKIADFSKYNMFKPNTEEYWAMKRGLKEVVSILNKCENLTNSFLKSYNMSGLGMFKAWSPVLCSQILKKVAEIEKEFGVWNNIKLTDEGKERFETIILKILGYEGVDVRGLKDKNGTASPDKFSEGSVIFDLKPDTYCSLAEAYYKAKSDDTNPELVIAVEELVS